MAGGSLSHTRDARSFSSSCAGGGVNYVRRELEFLDLDAAFPRMPLTTFQAIVLRVMGDENIQKIVTQGKAHNVCWYCLYLKTRLDQLGEDLSILKLLLKGAASRRENVDDLNTRIADAEQQQQRTKGLKLAHDAAWFAMSARAKEIQVQAKKTATVEAPPRPPTAPVDDAACAKKSVNKVLRAKKPSAF